jgi:conjugative relaxase-like TrwC/TraI family protein
MSTMVSVGKLAVGQADYYLDQAGGRLSRASSVGSGVEDYYASGPEAAGRWVGNGCSSLRLAGPVAAEALRSVLGGTSPDGRTPLRDARTSVPGFDVTFSAPKSASLMFGVGSEWMQAAVLAAHTAAVTDALAYFEREVAVARRGRGGGRLVPGRGLVAAAFVHRTSRAGDPQLHTHVLVANAVQDETGRWSALDGRRVYQHARTAGFLYQLRLRAEFSRRLGVEWTEVWRGMADVAGIPRPVLRAFSRRRIEIEEAMKAAGVSSAPAAEFAALQTRRSKDRLGSAETLRPEWIDRAGRLGIDRAALARLTGQAAPPQVTEDGLERARTYLLGPEGLTKYASTFSRADALRGMAALIPPGADVSVQTLERAVDGLLVSPAVVPVLRPAGRLPSDFRYSTAELLALERKVLRAADLADAALPTATPDARERALRARPTLAQEQAEMVERITSDTMRVAVVVGKAGTGKTFALEAARAAWVSSGVPVIGAAVANRAARELEDGTGIPSTSLQSLLMISRRRGLPAASVVVLDEASMAGTRQMAELLDHVASAGGKLVVVGDDHQLPAVEAGGAFSALVVRSTTVRLTENRRQVEHWERDALDLVRVGDAEAALDVYTRRGRVTLGPNPDSTRAALVRDWWAQGGPDGGVIIAFRRADVADLNRRARAVMLAAGRLGDTSLEVAEREFRAGDHVLLRLNDRRLGVANGERGLVQQVDREARTLTVAVGDRVVCLDARYLDAMERRTISHGYAITGHAAQGMTTSRAYVLGSEALYREWAYVALSRGRQLNRFYVVASGSLERDEFAPVDRSDAPLDAVRGALARSRAERLATEELARTLD